MVVVVGALLAFVSSSLSETISENIRLEKQQNILYALGVNENEGTSANFISTDVAGAAFSEYITKQIEVQGGKEVENSDAYLIDIKKQQTLAKQGKQRRLRFCRR